MKEIWVCRWEVIPGNGEQLEQFSTLSAAKQAMRRKISQYIDLKEYLINLEPRVARFLGRYLSEPQFPKCKNEVPDDYEDPEYSEVTLDSGSICWGYPCKAFPRIETNLVLDETYDGQYYFDFWYDCPKEAPKNRSTALSIRIYSQLDYGTSAYPLMVLHALGEEPATQSQLIRRIHETWQTDIDRKAVGRHLQLLQDIGLPVQHNAEGYYYEGEVQAPKPDIKYSPSAYPLLILQVLDGTPKTQTAIIQAVQEKYGVKIDRKAVRRHLDLLKEMHFKMT